MRCIAAITLLLAISCASPLPDGKTVFISVAIGYGTEGSANYLANPPSDQKALSAQIRALSEGSGEEYEEYLFLEEDGIRSISGQEAEWDHGDVLGTIRKLDTSPSDLIIFHYSGHGDESGSLVTDRDTSYRLPPDTLLDALGSVPGFRCLFLDSCYSGTFIRGDKLADGEVFTEGNLASESFVNSLLPSFILSFFAGRMGNRGIWVLSAATSGQASFDSWDEGLPGQDGYGAFTYYLASALGYDMEMERAVLPPPGSSVTFYGLYRQIKDMMTASLWREATPQVTLSPLDLLLFRL